jgi:hypothetical protein
MVDAEAIRLAVKAIEADPDSWDQRNWIRAGGRSLAGATMLKPVKTIKIKGEEVAVANIADCKTTCCLAGHAALQAGWVPVSDDVVIDPETGKMATWQDAGQRALGLNNNQASRLFSGEMPNNLDTLKLVITQETGVTFE